MSLSNIEKINDIFKIPLYYNKEKKELHKNIITDLELTETIDASGTSIFEYTFQPKTQIGKKVLEQMPLHFTTDITYLKQTQELIKQYKTGVELVKPDDILAIWDTIKNDTGFKDRYQYLDWAFLESLNHSKEFLQLMSIYNLCSPVLSLLMPLFILIIPFFVIQAKGLTLSISEYIQVLTVLLQGHAIGKLFTKFNSVKMDEKIYLLISVAFYFFSIYQNVLTCIRFHKNIKTMHTYMKQLQVYLKETEEKMYSFLSFSSALTKYETFNEKIKEHISVLATLRKELELILPYQFSLQKFLQLGHILKYFYKLHSDVSLNESFLFSFGFHGFVENIEGLKDNIDNGFVQFSKIDKPGKKGKKDKKGKKGKKGKEGKEGETIEMTNTEEIDESYFKDSYYPPLKNSHPKTNDIYLNRNMIITGPNASGKTTVLKSSLINILLTQQIGAGFYSEAYLEPFHFIHCYLNIPDTSGRDSLFQAEARRCKDILDIVKENEGKRHFCVFDELYSGTNPEEAVMSANAFMNYLVKNKNVHSLLTTHFADLCKHLEKQTAFVNYHMDTREKDGDIEYTYTLKDGISEKRGGVQVLKNMNYPKEIIENTIAV